MTRVSAIIICTIVCCLIATSSVMAAQSVTLKAGFSPNKPGSSTTVSIGFDIKTHLGVVPPPLVEEEVQLPAGMGLGMTNLGEAVCTPITLELVGVEGCSSNSYMGLGEALVEVPFGPELVQEPVSLAIFMAQAVGEHTTMLFLAAGETPVQAEVIFQGQLLNDTGPYGARLRTTIPVVESLPQAPDAAVVSMRSTLGPQGITYFRTARGQRIPFRPKGIVIPSTCPHGGYPFAASFRFLDGSTASATSSVPCSPANPRHRRRKRGRG